MCTKHLPRVMGCLLSVVLGAALAAPASGATGTILLVVASSGSLTTQEAARKTLMEGWGYTVTAISDNDTVGTFDTAVLTSSCIYVCESVSASTLSTKVANRVIPVIFEENDQVDEMKVATGTGTFTGTAIDITNTTHYITSTFSTGSRTLLTSSATLVYTTGTASGMTTLAERLSSSSPMLLVCERGDTLTSGTAAGRRVFLPWGGGELIVSTLTADGQTLLKRSIEWCLMPVSWWKLDEGTGSTCVDSASGHNGTRTGAAWTTGKLSNALDFDGTDDYVSIADDQDYDVTNALTIAAWIRADAAWPTSVDVAAILRKGDANPNVWQLSICGGKIECSLDGSDNAGYKGNTTLTTGTWHHVAVTWNGDKVRLYLNGVLDNTPPTKTTAISTDGRSVYIGGRTGSTDVHNGALDDVRFYNRALTAAEVAALCSTSKVVTAWKVVTPQ